MSFLEQLRIIKRLHQLTLKKGTGSPAQLSDRLRVSRATLFRYIETLKLLGGDIKYCQIRQTYYYQNNFKLNIDELVF